MELFLTDGRRISQYKYALVGREKLETELGPIDTLHVKKVQAPDDERAFEVWLAVEQHHLPVRIRYTEKDGTGVDSVVTMIRFEWRAVSLRQRRTRDPQSEPRYGSAGAVRVLACRQPGCHARTRAHLSRLRAQRCCPGSARHQLHARACSNHAAEALRAVLRFAHPADAVLRGFFREHRALGNATALSSRTGLSGRAQPAPAADARGQR